MCGRFSLTCTFKTLSELFGLLKEGDLSIRYNIAPGSAIPVVREREGTRELVNLRWGFVPHWAKEQPAKLLINARGETIREKPSFREAARKRRCLVPADGFYEWRRQGTRPAQPYFVTPNAGGPVAFAGLWEAWQSPSGEIIETVAIITTKANETLQPIHHRMPVVIAQEDFDLWLGSQNGEEMFDLVKPADNAFFKPIPVGQHVNKTVNNGPELQIEVPEDALRTESQTQLSLFSD